MMHYYRCTDCLAVSTAPERYTPTEYGQHAVALCGFCERKTVEYLGRVSRDRLIQSHEACACDERCTGAKGPLCSCSCGGENHGAGLSATVTVTTDHGAIPTITPAASMAKYRAFGQTFRACIGVALAELDAINTEKARTGWLPRPMFDRALVLRRALYKARNGRTQAGRMKVFASAGVVPSAVAA